MRRSIVTVEEYMIPCSGEDQKFHPCNAAMPGEPKYIQGDPDLLRKFRSQWHSATSHLDQMISSSLGTCTTHQPVM